MQEILGDTMGNKTKTKKLVTIAIMLSISIVLSIVESLFPIGVTGAKLGLANIITLVVMYLYSPKDATLVLLLRILLVALLYSGFGSLTFWLSLSGGTVALMFMLFIKLTNRFTIVSVSVVGSLGHAAGQIFAAMILMNTAALVFYFPVIFLVAIPTGVFVGITAQKFISIAKNQNLIEIAEN